MTPFIRTVIEENKNLHIIAYMGNYIVGYNEVTNRAYYTTETFTSDLLSEMDDNYQEWVRPLLDKLNITVSVADSIEDYYEVLTLS